MKLKNASLKVARKVDEAEERKETGDDEKPAPVADEPPKDELVPAPVPTVPGFGVEPPAASERQSADRDRGASRESHHEEKRSQDESFAPEPRVQQDATSMADGEEKTMILRAEQRLQEHSELPGDGPVADMTVSTPGKRDVDLSQHRQEGDDLRPESLKIDERRFHALTPPPPTVADNRVKVIAPQDKVFDRQMMLRIWKVHRGDIHEAVRGLHTNTRPGEKSGPPGGKNRNPIRGHCPPERADVSKKVAKDTSAMKPSANAWKGRPEKEKMKREDEIEGHVKSLLNKICPENLKIIVERLADFQLYKAEELEFVIRLIFQKSLGEPHYCETYSDMVFALKNRYPEFPAPEEGEKAINFTRVLLNTVQNEFETLPHTFEATEEEKEKYSAEDLKLEMKKRKDKMLANMKFIGHLFLRQLLAVKVIGQVVHDLIGIQERLPEEHMIECVCELLQAIGYTLDSTTHGKLLMSQFSARLVDLKRIAGPEGETAFSKRIQFQIQDLLDLRANGWVKKLFKEQAKTRDEVRKDAMKEAKSAARGNEVTFNTTTAGVRPSYIDEFKTPKPARQQKTPEAPQKPTFDLAYVKRTFQYYSEEKNKDELQQSWEKASPSTKEAKQGIEWLLDIGFNDAQKEDVVAETIVELLMKGTVVKWDILKDALSPYMEGLEDMKMDIPQADIFFHSLLSRLLLTSGRDFNPSFFKVLPLQSDSRNGCQFVWGLLIGALRKVRNFSTDAVRRALDVSELTSALCKAKRCKNNELTQYLKEEDVL